MFLAQVILVSPQCIPTDYHPLIYEEMEEFLTSTHYETMMNGELRHWYVWSTFMPYIKLAYLPNTPQEEGPVGELQLLSLQMIIFALQNMLGRDNHREALLEEGLLDYIKCMPEYVPSSLRPQSKVLVQMLEAFPDIPQVPPKLTSLVKARLAKTHFGLEKIVSLAVGEIVSQVYPMSAGH